MHVIMAVINITALTADANELISLIGHPHGPPGAGLASELPEHSGPCSRPAELLDAHRHPAHLGVQHPGLGQVQLPVTRVQTQSDTIGVVCPGAASRPWNKPAASTT